MNKDNLVPDIDDEEIRQRVESLVGGQGKTARILDCEKKSSHVTEEVLLLNGKPVKLTGVLGEKIKEALKAGLPPPPEVLSEILIRAGIESAPVELETTMSVKSSTKTSELSTLKDSHGMLIDEKLKEFEEDDEYESTNVEMWEKEPEHLRAQFDAEKAKMWDFYKSMQPLIKSSNVRDNASATPKDFNPEEESMYENVPKKADFSSARVSPKGGMKSFIIEEEMYENTKSYSGERTTRVGTSEGESISPPRLPERNMSMSPTKSSAEGLYENMGPVNVRNTSLPGRMPHLSQPSNPKLRPPIPPKPKFKEPNLRRELNFQLPVRVVYETFI